MTLAHLGRLFTCLSIFMKVRIAVPLEVALRGLEGSMEEEGLFRVGPGLLQLKKDSLESIK